MKEINLSLPKNLPNAPGVYRMHNASGRILYVGKARNLKKRVSSYFRAKQDNAKTASLMAQVTQITVTVTHDENEALLLEASLIKQHKPKYNVLLRDDKSYPYLLLSSHKTFPSLCFYRGSRAKGQYFGPYPSAGAVRETLSLLQKLFKVRQCSEPFFRSRKRPCLQYYIQRCTAPCVGLVSPEAYQDQLRDTVLFLQGKSDQVLERLRTRMKKASAGLDYEQAAFYRNRLTQLRKIQLQQCVVDQVGETDIVAITLKNAQACVTVLSVRGGRLLGHRDYFPRVPLGATEEEVFSSFLPQYYVNPIRAASAPQKIFVNLKLKDKQWLAMALSQRLEKRVSISETARGRYRRWLAMAVENAKHALNVHLADKAHYYERFEALQRALHMSNLPQQIECMDVSHTQGEATVASCVVFNQEGPFKTAYRRYNIARIQGGDDYAAIAQALHRRYARLKRQNKPLSDVLLIDGGKGQLSVAVRVLEALQVTGVIIMSIAKGPARKPGEETLWLAGCSQPMLLSAHSDAFHLLQHIRDEAHRFAISGHRKQRSQRRLTSPLERVTGVGPGRRASLLAHFGGLQEVKRASVTELAEVPGISQALAQAIFSQLHE